MPKRERERDTFPGKRSLGARQALSPTQELSSGHGPPTGPPLPAATVWGKLEPCYIKRRPLPLCACQSSTLCSTHRRLGPVRNGSLRTHWRTEEPEPSTAAGKGPAQLGTPGTDRALPGLCPLPAPPHPPQGQPPPQEVGPPRPPHSLGGQGGHRLSPHGSPGPAVSRHPRPASRQPCEPQTHSVPMRVQAGGTHSCQGASGKAPGKSPLTPSQERQMWVTLGPGSADAEKRQGPERRERCRTAGRHTSAAGRK